MRSKAVSVGVRRYAMVEYAMTMHDQVNYQSLSTLQWVRLGKVLCVARCSSAGRPRCRWHGVAGRDSMAFNLRPASDVDASQRAAFMRAPTFQGHPVLICQGCSSAHGFIGIFNELIEALALSELSGMM